MKNKIKIAACLLSVSMLFSSCDFLDITPNGKLDETSVLTDAGLAESYVVQIYADAWCFYDIYASAYVSDECMVTSDNQYAWDIQTQGKMTPDQFPGAGTNNGSPVWIWPQTYKTISHINKFFEYADAMTGEAKLKEQLIGEMHFLRGFYYMELMKRFGGVPIITKVFTLDDPTMYDVRRASYKDCVKFVCDEFDLAAAVLPFKYETGQLGRATKGAALGYKSRLMLYAASAQWVNESGVTPRQAADAALEVIELNSNMYQLESKFEEVFYNNLTPEAIFIRVHDQANDGQVSNYFTGWGAPCGWGGYSVMSVSQGLVDEFELSDGKMPSAELYDGEYDAFINRVGKNPSEAVVLAEIDKGKYAAGGDPWANRDPRLNASIVYDGELLFKNTSMEGTVASFIFPDLKTGGSDSHLGDSWWNASKTGYSCRKLIDERSLTGVWKSGSNKPCIFMRLAEVYLNYAEASYLAGDEGAARTYLNKVRQRARNSSKDPKMLPDVMVGGEELFRAIQHERRVELAFEDLRYYDVRRWKIAEETESKPIRGVEVIATRDVAKRLFLIKTAQPRTFISPNYNLYPIPNSERRRNTNLEQNPGYGGL